MSYMKRICERCGEEYIGKGNGKICEDCHRDITNMRLDRIDWFKCKDRTIRREIRKSGDWLLTYLNEKTPFLMSEYERLHREDYMRMHDERISFVLHETDEEMKRRGLKKREWQLEKEIQDLKKSFADLKYETETKSFMLSCKIRESSNKKLERLAERFDTSKTEALEQLIRREYDRNFEE